MRMTRDWIDRTGVPRPRGLLVATLLSTAAMGCGPVAPECDDGCPRLGSLDQYEPPAAPTLYDRHDSAFAWLPGIDRVWVPLDQMPTALVDGFVAVEDRRFHEHGGIDLRSVLRAARVNLTAGSVEQGASTITMQLARNLWPTLITDYGRWHRKFAEVRLARTMESELEKDRILELYLNQIYLGDGVYGVGAAALHYFGVPVQELGLDEIALIVGMARGPERYDPRSAPDLARARRDVVLDVFAREGIVPSALIDQARRRDLPQVEPRLVRGGRSWYASAVRRELRAMFPDPAARQGLHVFTALDPQVQGLAQEALRGQITAIEASELGRYEHPVPDGPLTAAPAGSPYLQGMVVVLDSENGAVRAVVGGRDFSHSEFDRAFQARRQAGSAFKPIVYAAALSSGVTPADRFDTAAVRMELAGEDDLWTPRESADLDGLMTVRTGLVRSSNRAAIWLGQQTGLGPAIRTAQALGVESRLPRVPSLFLGSGEVVPAELVAAYGALSNGGRALEPHLIRRVQDRWGRVLYEAPQVTDFAIDPEIAFLVRQAMEDVVDRGTGWRAREGGYRGPAAGKTGTTNDAKDVWFVGATPELVAGVWLGFDEPRSILAGASGGRLAAPVWGRLMAGVHEDAPHGEWTDRDARQRLIRAQVDISTGHLATPDCPGEHVASEWFVPGTEPATFCPLHGPDFASVVSQARTGAPAG